MDKRNTGQGKKVSTSRPADEAAETVREGGLGTPWIREDGAICFGAECLVLKPSDDGKNLDIEISPTRCGELHAEALRDTIFDTIGKGGDATFKIKGELRDEQSD